VSVQLEACVYIRVCSSPKPAPKIGTALCGVKDNLEIFDAFLLHIFVPQQCRVLVSPQRPSGAMRIAAALSSLEWVLPARVCPWPTRFACPTVWNAAAFLCVSLSRKKTNQRKEMFLLAPFTPFAPRLRSKARVGAAVECSDSPLLPHGHASRSPARSVGGSHRGHRTR
jgi:hypothetical protein